MISPCSRLQGILFATANQPRLKCKEYIAFFCMKTLRYRVETARANERLDSFVSEKSGYSRSYVQKLIKKGFLRVNRGIQKARYRIKTGDLIEISLPEEPENRLLPEDVPLDIIWEDKHIIVINKPCGMVVHPSAGHRRGTLINALITKCGKLASIGAPLRPGVVHRLDKDTSGLIVFAKDDNSYLNLQNQFKKREVEKNYLALVYGDLKKQQGEIKRAIGRAVSDRKKMSVKTKKGREALTHFEVVKRMKAATLVNVSIITGRTHQIRVHFAAIGHPVLGDRIYGKKTSLKFMRTTIQFQRQMLHAQRLRFRHPVNNNILSLTAPVPEDMKKAIEELSGLKQRKD
jgi:23S rRNA pseudouridine1911/1915/1917 synthase